MKSNTAQSSDMTANSQERTPAHKRLKKVFFVILGIIAFVFIYLFLLLGEPDEEQKATSVQALPAIENPVSPMEATDTNGLQNLADAFENSILCLYSGADLEKARLEDIPYASHYARVVTLTYRTEDNKLVQLKSVRPKEAASLWYVDGAELYAKSLYSLAGLNGSRMDAKSDIIIMAQNDHIAYSAVIPNEFQDELTQLLRQTYMVSPSQKSTGNEQE